MGLIFVYFSLFFFALLSCLCRVSASLALGQICSGRREIQNIRVLESSILWLGVRRGQPARWSHTDQAVTKPRNPSASKQFSKIRVPIALNFVVDCTCLELWRQEQFPV